MSPLTCIPGLGQTTLELLEAAGFQSVEAIARAEAPALLGELHMANRMLHIAAGAPSLDEVNALVAAARSVVGVDLGVAGVAGVDLGGTRSAASASASASASDAIDHESSPEVQRMLASAPFAIPLPSGVLRDQGLGVGDIPAGILLNRYAGDLDVRAPVSRPVPAVVPAPAVQDLVVRSILPAAALPTEASARPSVTPQPSLTVVQLAESTTPRQSLDLKKVRTFQDAVDDSFKLPAEPQAAVAKAPGGSDRVSLIRTPREATNRGRDPKSRRYIRGVLHSHPVSIYLGALVTVPTLLMFPVALAAAVLLLLSDLAPLWFSWVPSGLIALPIALPVLGLLWMMTAMGGVCRVCGQKLFVHRSHLKSPRAHRFPLCGYVLPLCLHILFFRWFRCSHCGTPIRLKE